MKINRLKKAIGATAFVASLLAAGSGCAWAAQSYASSSRPLSVSGYGSTASSFGTWSITHTNGTRSQLSASVRIINADDHKVYAYLTTYTNSGICFSGQYLSCSQPFYKYASTSTGRFASPVWVKTSAATSLPGTANVARAGIQTGIDIPFRADPLSTAQYTRGESY